MLAAVLGEAGVIETTRKPVPEIGDDDVLIRVHRASLCGTDVKIRSRSFFGGADSGPEPGTFTPGHEYSGVVAAVGASVDEFAVGDRVVTEAHRGCMRCANCLSGGYTNCLNYGIRSKGHRVQGMTVQGGFAEYVSNHVSTLTLLPDSVGFDDAVVLTTAGTVMHAFQALDMLAVGSSVAVIGPGPIGLLAVQVARQLGAAQVFLIGTRESRLALGKQFGADLVVNSRSDDPVAAVRAATGGRGADIVLECSGAGAAVDTALHASARGGNVVLVGFFGQPVTADLNHAVMNGITLKTVRGEGAGSVARAVTLAGLGRLSTDPLVTHRFPLIDIAAAFDAYTQRTDNAIKVMLDVTD
ncbi:zinc-dependent alcohol dehydrogenase [Nocardia otitidiscaviarum]|uniref:zinc-dependent alcohol dehydrogenase n=1 Tax=Nocardia otitidiscaviarum TaxID=1823 RepID=UPI00226BBF54|nr:zinc-binding dehydrogenase [Nocardia otitidiscaviarum]